MRYISTLFRHSSFCPAGLLVLTLAAWNVAFNAEADAFGQSPPEWVDLQVHDGIAYFLFPQQMCIERYSLAEESWLSSVELAFVPSAFNADSQYLYIGFNDRISRFNLDGYGETVLKVMDHPAETILTLDDYLYIQHNEEFLMSINKHTGTLIEDKRYTRFMGSDLDPVTRRIFSREYISPPDICAITLRTDGTMGLMWDSPYHASYPNASRVFVFTDVTRVADNSGTVYNTMDLTYSGSLGGPFDDVAFYHEFPVVLRDGVVFGYDNTFAETGRYTPAEYPQGIIVFGEKIYLFNQDGNGNVRLAVVPVSVLNLPEPGLPVDPKGLAYDPDEVFRGSDGTLYLVSRQFLSIFRFSMPDYVYLETIPLYAAPSRIDFSPELNRFYLDHGGQYITCIDLEEFSSERLFVTMDYFPREIVAAGEYLVVTDYSREFYVYDPDGFLKSSHDYSYYSYLYYWCGPNRHLYFVDISSTSNTLIRLGIDAQGNLGEMERADYSEPPCRAPIRISPDGLVGVSANALVFDAEALETFYNLSNDISDAVWFNGHLYSIRETGIKHQVQKWDSGYLLETWKDFPGRFERFFAGEDGIVLISIVNGIPAFYLLDAALENITPALIVDLTLSLPVFTPGDEFLLEAAISNPGPTVYQNLPFVVILEMYGLYFFHPGWSQTFSFEPLTLYSGVTTREILRFPWPDVTLEANNFRFYGALLDYDFSRIMGFFDSITFGCNP